MMSGNLKILIAAFLFTGIFTPDRTCTHLDFGRGHLSQEANLVADKQALLTGYSPLVSEHLIHFAAWQEEGQPILAPFAEEGLPTQATNAISPHLALAEPIEVDWRVLLDIEYKLRYFEELGMKMYSPVFTEAVTALHGKEVIIEGFVIPFDEESEALSLSYNPYASCFFCGKASPASIISMYLKNKRKRYKMDDFKKFKGRLYLNHDDPNEFYYILRDAEEQKPQR